MRPLLEANELTVRYPGSRSGGEALKGISFSLGRGEALGIAGESGSGKTTLALALLGILDGTAEIEGRLLFEGIDLLSLSEKERNRYRWKRLALVFQNSLEILNPAIPLRTQIAEALLYRMGREKKAAFDEADRLLSQTGLDSSWGDRYPHELSGGMLQRALVAMALTCGPDVLVADEPTASLDGTSKAAIVELLRSLRRERGFSLLLISHEADLVRELTDRTLVLYAGSVAEEGPTADILGDPRHPYSRGLFASSPALNPFRDLWGIPGERTGGTERGCPFFPRCRQSLPGCALKKPELKPLLPGPAAAARRPGSGERRIACFRGGAVSVLAATGVSLTFRGGGRNVAAVDGVSCEITAGEVVALVGPSGSGKSTLAKLLAGVLPPEAGNVVFDGEPVAGNNMTRRKGGLQLVFQDPYSSIDEHFTVLEAVEEPLVILNGASSKERLRAAAEALGDVLLPSDGEFLGRRCHTLSGGQRQRVALARALVMKPKLLLADEICSMLDSSTQANLLRMLKGLQNEHGFAMLYITHDLAAARKIADRTYTMQEGRLL